MAEQFLNTTNVDAGFEQVRGKRVAQCVRRDFLGESRHCDSARQRSSDTVFVEVMATLNAGARIDRQRRRWKDPMPGPALRRSWKLRCQGIRQPDTGAPLRPVMRPQCSRLSELRFERCPE